MGRYKNGWEHNLFPGLAEGRFTGCSQANVKKVSAWKTKSPFGIMGYEDSLIQTAPAFKPLSIKRHRFPPQVILHAVWLYFRFTLSLRDVDDQVRATDRATPEAPPIGAQPTMASR